MQYPSLLKLLVFVFYQVPNAQILLKYETKDSIPGICYNNEILMLQPRLDRSQINAVSPVSIDSVEKRLNEEIVFLKDKSKYRDHGKVSLIVNCHGELIQCFMEDKTKSITLDSQILAFFDLKGRWRAGEYDNRKVDSILSFSFNIRKGQLKINRQKTRKYFMVSFINYVFG